MALVPYNYQFELGFEYMSEAMSTLDDCEILEIFENAVNSPRTNYNMGIIDAYNNYVAIMGSPENV